MIAKVYIVILEFLKHFCIHYSIYSSQELCEVTVIITFFLNMRKLGLRESYLSDLPVVPELPNSG